MPSPTQKFERTFKYADFGKATTATGVLVSTSSYTEVGRLTVPAGQQIAWGIGNTSGGVDTRRNVTIYSDDTNGTAFNGTIRLAVANPSVTDIRIVMEDRTENLINGVKLAESKIRAGEDRHLLVFLKGDNASTLSYADATVVGSLFPCTVYQ